MAQPRWQMLPGALGVGGDGRRSARDWIVDAMMSLIAFGIGLIVIAEVEPRRSDAINLLDLVVGLACIAALWWRRRHPLAVGVLTTVPGAVLGFSAGASLFALFNLALRGSRREVLLLVVLGLGVSAIYPAVYPETAGGSYLFNFVLAVLFTLVVVPWGLFARTQRAQLREAHERAERAEAEQRARVDQAREGERRRIAGEMHDVLAHRLSLLSVHAGALEFRPDAPPEEIAHAAGVIRATARAALQDLREVIGVLREPANGVVPPQPTLDAIPALVEESRAAGMKVTLHIAAGGGDALLGRTAYRVVQEGLTNARKHAPAAAVEVSVAAEDALVVEVVSRRSAIASDAGPGGTGLIGLSERVQLAGGALEHGPNGRGDFVLRATLPWPP
jgi:signal transduction histidine kinase